MALWTELRRRSIFKVGVTYAVLAWLIVQVANNFFVPLNLPAWTITLVTVLVIIGFPIALLLAWAYEMTPDGIKPTRHVPVDKSLANIRGQKLNFYMTGVLALAVAFMAGDRYLFEGRSQPTNAGEVAEQPADPVRFFIDEPAGSQFLLPQEFPHPALSADGQRVAFIAPPRTDNPGGAPPETLAVLWLQRVGELEAQPLIGTEGASYPFWSPDGRNVAYGANGSLNRYATGGAAPQLIAEIEGYTGGSWGGDGTIIFASRTGLQSVPADGGAISQVTRIAADENEFSHRHPVFFPDGRRFIYLIAHPNPERDGIYLGSLDDAPESRQRLTASESNGKLAIGPDGRAYLLYVQNFTLVAQAFDTELNALTDEVHIVAPQVEPGAGGRLAPFAAGGQNLIYRPRYRPNTEMTRFSRNGVPLEAIDLGGATVTYPALSADGSKLAFTRNGDTTRSIWWFDLDRGLSERVTVEGDVYVMPSWSNAGDRVFFTRLQVGGGYDIYAKSLSGSEDETPIVTGVIGPKYMRDVTTDGEFVVFQAGVRDIWAARADGSGNAFSVLESNAVENHAKVSPDGDWIAYSSTDPGGRSEIYVTSFPAPGQQSWRVSTDGGVDPQWRADGREIYFIAPNNMLMSVAVTLDGEIDIAMPEPMFRVNPEPWSMRFGSVYSPAPDGQSFIVNEMVGNNSVQLLAVLNWNVQQ